MGKRGRDLPSAIARRRLLPYISYWRNPCEEGKIGGYSDVSAALWQSQGGKKIDMIWEEKITVYNLADQKSITLPEFLAEYSPGAWLGFLEKNGKSVISSELRVDRAMKSTYEGKTDVYLAYNPLKKRKSRSKDNIGRLAVLYVDLDIGRGKDPLEDDTTPEYKQRIIDSLDKKSFGKSIPKPNYICDSGRGLYLLYMIYQNEDANKQEHPNAAGRWERISTYITAQLEEFHADKSVSTDEARVLRIPGSINSHTGTEVRFYRYSTERYTLHRIEYDYMNEPTQAQIEKLARMEATLGITCTIRNKRSIRVFMQENEEAYRQACACKPASQKQLQYVADIATLLGVDVPQIRTSGQADEFIKAYKDAHEDAKRKNCRHGDWLGNRLRRLERVIIDAPKDSYREIALFFYRLFACECTNDKKLAATMTRELIRRMTNPLPERSAMRSTRTAERYWEGGYAHMMSDKTLAAWFGMTLDEWLELLPGSAHGLRKRERNRRYYEKKLAKNGETTKKNKIAARREEVARLLSMGKTKAEICEKAGISERTLYSDLKFIKEHAVEEQETAPKNSTAKNSAPCNRGHLCPSLKKRFKKYTYTETSTPVYMRRSRETEQLRSLTIPLIRGYHVLHAVDVWENDSG